MVLLLQFGNKNSDVDSLCHKIRYFVCMQFTRAQSFHHQRILFFSKPYKLMPLVKNWFFPFLLNNVNKIVSSASAVEKKKIIRSEQKFNYTGCATKNCLDLISIFSEKIVLKLMPIFSHVEIRYFY